MSELPECTTCGACCSVGYTVGVHASEVDRVARAMLRVTSLPLEPDGYKDPRSKSLPIVNGRCPALQGSIGTKAVCGIYPARPEVCARFSRGGQQCLEVRAAWFGTDDEIRALFGDNFAGLDHLGMGLSYSNPSRGEHVVAMAERLRQEHHERSQAMADRLDAALEDLRSEKP